MILFVFSNKFYGQAKLELHAGISYTNINDNLIGQHQVFIYPTNSPNYLLNFNAGLSKKIFERNRIGLQVGLNLTGRGSRDFAHIVFPVDTVVVHRLYYLQVPIMFNYRLLNNKGYYLLLGLSPGYLIKQSEYDLDGNGESLEVFPTAIKYQMDYSFGVRVPICQSIDVKLNYSQGIFKLSKSDFNVSNLKSSTINHAFEISIIYKL